MKPKETGELIGLWLAFAASLWFSLLAMLPDASYPNLDVFLACWNCAAVVVHWRKVRRLHVELAEQALQRIRDENIP